MEEQIKEKIIKALSFMQHINSTDVIGEFLIEEKTLKQWDDYFTVKIHKDIGLKEIRDLLVELGNKLDTARYLISVTSRKYRWANTHYNSIINEYISENVVYSKNRAVNMTRVEREAGNSYDYERIAIEQYETILGIFKDILKNLQNKIEVAKLIQYNLTNELKHLQ